MKFQSANDVIELVKAFEGRRILKPQWSHSKQLVIGLYYCLRFPFGKAITLMRDGLKRQDETFGIANSITVGYHETLTVFWLLATKQFVEITKSYNLAEQANELISVYQNDSFPLQFYSRELLTSRAARNQHIPPDLDRFYLFVISSGLLSQIGNIAVEKKIDF